MSNIAGFSRFAAIAGALVTLSACADGTDRSLAQAPIVFGDGGQAGAAAVAEPDAASTFAVGGDALLPTAAPATSVPVLPTAAGGQASAGLTDQTAGQTANASVSVGPDSVALATSPAAVQLAAAPAGEALAGAGAVTQAVVIPVAATLGGGAADVGGLAGAGLTASGSILGVTNSLATSATAAVTPVAPNLLTNGATTARRGACTLHLGC